MKNIKAAKGTVLLLCLSSLSCGGGNTGISQFRTDPVLDCSKLVQGENMADDFVCEHNAIREAPPSPQPLPVPLLAGMQWNTELAAFAQAHAEKCVFAHSNSSDQVAVFSEPLGENIAANTGTSSAVATVQLWAAESASYDYDTNSCAAGQECGHYTQIVWRESIQLGCGMARCATLTGTGFAEAQFWVCNYLPAGNFIGEKPY